MKRKNVLIFLLLFTLFIVLYYVFAVDLPRMESQRELISISVIVRGATDNNWATVKQGIDQAALDLHVDVSFITLANENDRMEQQSLLEREVANGADAVLVAAADSQWMAPVVASLASRVPVVTIECPTDSPKESAYISGDNRQMGIMLAEEIIRRGLGRSGQRVAVIAAANQCDNVLERQQGIVDTLEIQSEAHVDVLPAADDLSDVADIMEEIIENKSADVVVGPDLAALQLAAQVLGARQPVRTAGPKILLFGVGGTGVIAPHLEKGVVTATVVQNDFNIGYLGLQAAVAAVNGTGEKMDTTVAFHLITRENMFEPDSQKLLFPFVR